jgi:hypothetical protein
VEHVVHQSSIDLAVARRPRYRVANTEFLEHSRLHQIIDNVIHVVAQRWLRALLADVVDVDIAGRLYGQLSDLTTVVECVGVISRFEILRTLSVLLLDRGQGRLRDQVVGVQVRSERLELNQRIDQTITNGNGYIET